MLQANSSLTPAQILTAMQNTAQDMDNPDTVGFDTGFDNATGYGLIRADMALAAVVPTTGSISGQAYEDRNDSGTLDAGDVTLNGVTINLSGPASSSTTTSGSGNFSFSSLIAGSYNVSEVLPSGYVFTTSATLTPSVGTGATTGQNFGNFP